MATSCTNQTKAQAFNGQAALVTLNSTDAAAILPTLVAGRQATCGSSSKIGYVSNPDKLGCTFEVVPVNQASRFDSSSTPGILNSGETITLQ